MIKNSLVIILSIILVNAQVTKICDLKTGDPLDQVNIYNKKIGTTTDENGLFDLEIFDDDDLITFSLIGYKNIDFLKSDIPHVIYMARESIPMELINVVGAKGNSRKNYIKLERDVRKVYPYALTVSNILREYEHTLDSLDNYPFYKRYYKKRKVFKNIEDDLISQYGRPITRLTKRQGRILIRLVDRETSRTSFNIIKDFRNILSAGFWQLTARIFGHNLKSRYDPKIGEDRMIEFILQKMNIEKK